MKRLGNQKASLLRNILLTLSISALSVAAMAQQGQVIRIQRTQGGVLNSDFFFCRNNQSPRYPYLTEEVVEVDTETGKRGVYRKDIQKFLIDSLEPWVQGFISAKDPLFVSQASKPICVGVFNDSQGANALAIGDLHIAFGVKLTAEINLKHKEAAPFAMKYVLAHEFAHLIQARKNLPFDYGGSGIRLPLLSTKVKELHADCMAGYILEMYRQIPYQFAANVDRFIETLGDSHAVGDHGMAQQRTEAFNRGAKLANQDRVVGMTPQEIQTQRVSGVCALTYQPRQM